MNDETTAVDAREAERRLGGGAVLLDVREDDEWAAGHAPQARHIPLGQLPDRRGELSADDSLIVVCRSGSRSQRAQAALRQHGFAVANLDGGMRAWEETGLPVVRDDGTLGEIL